MGFFDLNIPYNESDRHVTDKSSLNLRRLKLTLKSMELGYSGVAFNRTLKGVMSDSHRCSTPKFPLSKITPNSSSSFFAAVEFHRRLLNVAVSAPFRQYTRLTVVVDSPAQASVLNSGNPVLRSYDIVAVRPMNQNVFDQACRTSEVDVIAIEFAERLPFRLKQGMVKAAIQRGVYFEITYSGLISDVQSRRQMISNCKLLVDWTRGKNLIFSSGAPSATELRGPLDVANLFSLLGLPMQHARAAISKNCRSLLANAVRKKHFYKEAIMVEEIKSHSQTNSEQSQFDDWLKWDPISSGEGDLLLEDMKKSFSMSKKVTKNVKILDFDSSINGLPAHGLQIKDLISMSKPDLEPLDISNSATAAMETDDEVKVCENPEDPITHIDVLPKEQREILLPEIQALSHGVSGIHENCTFQDSEDLLDLTPKQQVDLLPMPEGDQTSFDGAETRYQGSASGLEGSEMPSIPSYTSTCINYEEISPISSGKLNYPDDVGANLVASQTQLQGTQLKICVRNAFLDGGPVCSTKFEAEGTPVSHIHASVEPYKPLTKFSLTAINLEDSDVENRYDVGIQANKGVAMDRVTDEILDVNGSAPLASCGASSQDIYVEEEKSSQMNNSFVPLGDGLHLDGSINPKTNFSEHILKGKSLSGRRRRKQNPSHQPLLFPFKRFLSPRPFKRKARR